MLSCFLSMPAGVETLLAYNQERELRKPEERELK
jgi:hypothetical protein